MQSSFTTSDNRHVPSTSSTVSTHLKEALKHLRAIHIDRNTHQNLSPEDQQTLNRIHLLLNPQDHAAPSGEVPSTRQRSHEEQQNNPLARVKKRVAPTFVNIAPIDVVTNPVFAPEVEDLDQDSDGESVSSVESDITLDIEYTWCLDRRPKPGTASSAYYQYMQAIRVQKAQWWVADNVRKPEKTLDDDDTIVNFDEDDEIELTDDESDDDDEMELDQGLSIDESVAIIEAAIKEYENLWDKKKRPLRQAEALRFWQQFYDAFERYEASQAQKRKLKHFLKRLDSIKAGLLEGENANREILKRLCGALEATVFDIQDARFKESILDGFEAPISTKSPRHRRVKKIMDDLELDGLDIASESEAESNVDFIDIDENEENEENLEISDCQILGNDAMEIPSAPHSNVENLSLIPLIIIDLTLTDPESEFDPEEPKEQEAANVVEAPVQSAAEDGDSENAELLESDNGPPIVLTPHKKRKKEVKESKEGKELRAINARRFQEESERITQNLYQLRTDSSFTDGKSYVINIGKSEDEDFIFINSKASKCIKTHQVEGLQFLWREVIKERDAANASGCMLSHTMGLGKTLQAITLLVTIQEAAKSSNSRISSQIPEDLTESSTLILCPPNIVHNWQQEIMKWIPVPSILGPVYVINAEQPNYDRRDTISRWSVTKGVLIIGFHLFKMFFHPDRGDKETAQLLNSTPNLVIVDEAHNLKNTKASITDAARGLKTKRRIALTGTPISNNLEEYWSMIDFVSPGYLGTSVEFRARFAEPIECGNYKESTIFERRKAHTRLTVLEKHLQPKVHRRDASALKDTLPPLHDNIIKMKLTGEQITAYNEYVDLFKHSTEVMMHSSSFLTSIHDLILLCNHPRILHEGLTNRKKTNEQKIVEAGKRRGGGCLTSDQIDQILPALEISGIEASFKIMVCLELIHSAIAIKDKTLVFSQSISTLNFLESALQAKGTKYLRLDGHTKVQNRPGMIKDFNHDEGPSVFLISTTAGGEGTNMHGANRVIIFDFKFNPSKEEQAVGRAYRLGQTKPVYVYRLITDGSIESRLLNNAEFKMQLSYKVNEKKNASSMSTKLLKEHLFKPKEVSCLDNMDEFHSLNDKVLDGLINIHKKTPFITALESMDKYRMEEKLELTAEEENEVQFLLEQERSGSRSLHQTPILHNANLAPKYQSYPAASGDHGHVTSSQPLPSGWRSRIMSNKNTALTIPSIGAQSNSSVFSSTQPPLHNLVYGIPSNQSSQPVASTQIAAKLASRPTLSITLGDSLVHGPTYDVGPEFRVPHPSQNASTSTTLISPNSMTDVGRSTPDTSLNGSRTLEIENNKAGPPSLSDRANMLNLFRPVESASPDKERQGQRHQDYLDSLQTRPEFQVHTTLLSPKSHLRQSSDSSNQVQSRIVEGMNGYVGSSTKSHQQDVINAPVDTQNNASTNGRPNKVNSTGPASPEKDPEGVCNHM